LSWYLFLFVFIRRLLPRWTEARRILLTSLIAIAGVFMCPAIYECISLGQTGLVLLSLVTVDYFCTPTKVKGALVGVAVAIKIYPVIFVFWWLYKRNYRAAIVSTTAATAVTAISACLWPASFQTYLSKLIFSGGEVSKLESGLKMYANSSLLAPLLHGPLVSHPVATWLQVVIIVSGIVTGLWIAGKLVDSHPMTAFSVLCLVSVSCSFATWDHYLGFLVAAPLLAFEVKTWGGKVMFCLVGAASMIPFWRFRYVGGHARLSQFERFAGASGVWLISVVFFAAATAMALRTNKNFR
jgi:alpha-1,2-mannosyltransferase